MLLPDWVRFQADWIQFLPFSVRLAFNLNELVSKLTGLVFLPDWVKLGFILTGLGFKLTGLCFCLTGLGSKSDWFVLLSDWFRL